jgi:hypothetical protein
MYVVLFSGISGFENCFEWKIVSLWEVCLIGRQVKVKRVFLGLSVSVVRCCVAVHRVSNIWIVTASVIGYQERSYSSWPQ